jgi:hypothetical protein
VPIVTGIKGVTQADSTWIGIGGVSTGDLIQIGTQNTAHTNGGIASSAFYEILPQAARTITTITVSAGDTMNASVNEITPGQWKLTISDTTTGQSFTKTVAYNSAHSSAEWIEEDPTLITGSLIPLDSFAPIAFTGASTLSNGTTLNLKTSNAQPISMVATGQAIVTPSDIASDGGSFTVTKH